MNDKRNEAFRKVQEKKEARIAELLQEAEYLKSEIEAKHHIVRNQFKLMNIAKRLRRLR